ncbi:NADH dehydrogenase [ubiquinone] iron-sulfur protein 8, mitochondrial [Cricetulus griseus]|uniref:NADH dehydrogenase [ubiquinone] iron-sulfur protein 8, mitochondrial n=1 Tax=Cricetulus griseus TaxID=10029 RepID=G3GRH4_CRIGR|nr:NADH dehydrogenase [ubiquinone] iron-sulfur protein 8, mitochondrial [Cricetulus griseus]
MTKYIYCGFYQKTYPFDAIMEGIFAFSTKTPEELLYNKGKLFNNGDNWEAKISTNTQADYLHQ